MKLKLLGTLALSSIILTACGQENVKKNLLYCTNI